MITKGSESNVMMLAFVLVDVTVYLATQCAEILGGDHERVTDVLVYTDAVMLRGGDGGSVKNVNNTVRR